MTCLKIKEYYQCVIGAHRTTSHYFDKNRTISTVMSPAAVDTSTEVGPQDDGGTVVTGDVEVRALTRAFSRINTNATGMATDTYNGRTMTIAQA